jgi:hypothetical protein
MDIHQTNLPDFTPYLGLIGFALFVIFVLWFPVVAAMVAPEGRGFEFFLLTLLVLWGPLGVACAAVANPRD